MLVADTVLQKRYKVIRAVGHGGMGAVYLAKDLRLGSVVALKENFFNDEKMIKAFEHEARLLASLRHVALPKVFDHFSIGEGQFLVMEYIYGDDFVEMLEKRKKLIEPAGQPKPFEVHEVLPWAEQLLDALDYIHTQQYPIIHRDIKPQNLKLARRNQIILLDFGLAKGNSGQTFIKSTSGSVLGYTPNYAPIEQIQGVGTDPRTDLYSLGATFYHLLTGIAPIASTIRAESFLGGEADPLRPPRMFNAKIPPGLSDLIMTALQQHRNNRPPSAAEMLRMLRAVTHPAGGHFDTTQKIRDYRTTVMEAAKPDEAQQGQQEKARQEEIEAQRQKQLEEQARRSREEADARRKKLEDQLRQAQEEAERHRQLEEEARKAREEVEQLREQEARARQARQEAEKLRRELEEQTRAAIAEVERQVLLEEQARKSGEAIEQRKRQEEQLRKAQEEQLRKAQEAQAQERARQEAVARQQYIEEQARKAREEEQHKLQAAEQARKAQEEAERLRRQLEEQARKAEEQARRAQEEAQRRKLQEEEARLAREEAQRLKQLEQERQAQEEAERRKLQEELERRMKGEAQMQKALQDWEQMAREEAERKRLLEQQMEQAREEAERLKQLLEEQTLKATEEAHKRQSLEAQAQKAAQEAEKRKLLEEQARQATAEADHLRQMEQERKVREDWEKKKLAEERAQIAREENQRLQQLENLAQAAAQESERFKRQLEEQSRRAELEAEKRRELEEAVTNAERRLLEEQERNAEIERTERVTQVMSHTRELVAWDGIQESKTAKQQPIAPFYVPGNEPSMPPVETESERFIHTLDDEEKTSNRNKWIIAGAVIVILTLIVIIRIATPSETPTQAPPANPALASLTSADSYVQIQPGSFIMGSNTGEIDEKPAHKVVLTKGFEMGKYEVTQEQWQAIMGENPSKLRGANLPVDNISWNDVKNFIEKLNKRDTTRIYRLPFEAEWEYACRAGTEGEYPVKLDSVAWYLKNSENLTHPVGQKQPNAWGLYDMTGNAFEYCQDWYLQNYYSYYAESVNPMGPPSGTLCPIRGGNYGTPYENCRPARRWNADPREKFTGAGFRLVRLPR